MLVGKSDEKERTEYDKIKLLNTEFSIIEDERYALFMKKDEKKYFELIFLKLVKYEYVDEGK